MGDAEVRSIRSGTTRISMCRGRAVAGARGDVVPQAYPPGEVKNPRLRAGLSAALRTPRGSRHICRGDPEPAAWPRRRPTLRALSLRKGPAARSTRHSRSPPHGSPFRPYHFVEVLRVQHHGILFSRSLLFKLTIPCGSYSSLNAANTSCGERPSAAKCFLSLLRASCNNL